jgi:glycosyltransferase involved in cell wall biosynthesis
VHVLFVHKNFPAQFGHIASHLVQNRGWECTFVSERPSRELGGVRTIQYSPQGGASERIHHTSRAFENAIGHAAGVYEALKAVRSMVQPDLIVGHSGFGSTLFLRELFPDAPIINYFEYFYRSRDSDLDFRPEWPVGEADRLRSPARNAMILLDMEYCAAGYAPTQFQHSTMPEAYKPKIRVLHDGIDTGFWRRRDVPDRTLGSLRLGPEDRLITYVSRGLESIRGFDIFMRAAKRIYTARDDVTIVVVGQNRTAYGGDLRHTGGKPFRDWVLAQDDYDLNRVKFAGSVPPATLAQLFSITDLHVYLTVPFVLSWSLLDAMACEAVILASDTAPVREVIYDDQTGLLTDFFDDAALADRALQVLEDPGRHRALGQAARTLVQERYSMDVVMPEMTTFYEDVAARAAH